jgi:MtfA peptidase
MPASLGQRILHWCSALAVALTHPRQALAQHRTRQALARRPISDSLWHATLTALPFIQALPAADLQRLRTLVSVFLDSKEFSGAGGLQVTDAQAVMVATQACLPVLHIAPPHRPDLALRWYSGFVGIVLHPSSVRARRSQVDAAGVVHHWQEALSGEAMDGGPLMLAWSDVATAGTSAHESYNVVVHEFAHVMDMLGGPPDGCPPMPAAQRREWQRVMQSEFEMLSEQLAQWQRFGGMANGPEGSQNQLSEPLLSDYAVTNSAEFFAVAAEAYFVNPNRFAAAHPQLQTLFDGFFKPQQTQSAGITGLG